MDQSLGNGAALAIVGAIILAVSVWQFVRGTTYAPHPPLRVTRRDDPFLFWLSMAIQGAVGISCTALGLASAFKLEALF